MSHASDDDERNVAGDDAEVGAAVSEEDAVERLHGRLFDWLEGVLAREQPPEGLAAELLEELETPAGHSNGDPPGAAPGPDEAAGSSGGPGLADFHAVQASLTAVAQEVKLQGRAFKELAGGLASFEELAPLLRDVRDTHARQVREAAAEARRAAQKDSIDVLVDVRERLRRALAAAGSQIEELEEAPEPGWLARLAGTTLQHQARAALESARSVAEGCRLGFERLEESLQRMGVRELDCLGLPFDAHAMVTADVVESDTADPEGTVVEVYAAGYIWNGELLRPARVKVARPPALTSGNGEQDPEETEDAGRTDRWD